MRGPPIGPGRSWVLRKAIGVIAWREWSTRQSSRNPADRKLTAARDIAGTRCLSLQAGVQNPFWIRSKITLVKADIWPPMNGPVSATTSMMATIFGTKVKVIS